MKDPAGVGGVGQWVVSSGAEVAALQAVVANPALRVVGACTR